MEFFDSYNTGQLIEKINNCQKVFKESLLNKILEDAQRITVNSELIPFDFIRI